MSTYIFQMFTSLDHLDHLVLKSNQNNRPIQRKNFFPQFSGLGGPLALHGA